MTDDVAGQIARLRTLSRPQLFVVWQRLYGRPAPRGIRRELLVPFLAYRIQEIAFGGLKASSKAELRRIARRVNTEGSSRTSCSRPRIKPGTRLVRTWRGEVHEVSAVHNGYEHRGIQYKSLSEIARNITGTRWSGPVFFDLKNPNSGHRQNVS